MLVTNYRPTNRDLDPSALLENGRVSGQAKLTIMRPNLDRYHHTPLSHDQPFSNSSSRYSIPGSVKPYLLMPNRRKSPILDYPMHHVRSGGPKVYHRQSRMPNDHRNSHQKFFSHKISSHSFSHSNSLVPTIEDSQFLKRMIPSRPPQSPSQSSIFQQPFGQTYDQVRKFQDTNLEQVSDTQGHANDHTEYKSSYLHHVLHLQRQQTSRDILQPHYSSSAAASSSPHQPEDEVSELVLISSTFYKCLFHMKVFCTAFL